MKAGDVYRSDFQSDIHGGQYRLVEKVKGEPNTWIIEYLPPDEQTLDSILNYYVTAEANGYMTTPVWDKTWAQCGEGEHPERIGWTTYEQDMEAEIQRYEERAGTRVKTTFISSRRYAEYF